MKFRKLLEWLAHMEHEQWAHWTKYMLDHLSPENEKRWRRQIRIPYARLSHDEKESDREWAQKILDQMPFKCPMWQCGGIMQAVERKPPKGFLKDECSDGYDGDYQTPDLVCENCRTVYRFGGFKKSRTPTKTTGTRSS